MLSTEKPMAITIKALGIVEGTLVVPAISIGDGLTRAMSWLQDDHVSEGIAHNVARIWWTLLTQAHAKAIGDGVVQGHGRWWYDKDSQNHVQIQFDVFVIPTVVNANEQ